MKGRIDLTQGKITEKLVKLSLPIMATSFIQMAYNMIDMIWVGKAGSSAVAAVGTAGFFTWLAMVYYNFKSRCRSKSSSEYGST